MTTEIFVKLLPAFSFKPTSPANLIQFQPSAPTLSTVGVAGTVRLYVQHKNDRLSDWASLSDVVGDATLIGTLQTGVAPTMPDFIAGPGEEFIFWVSFQSANGTKPAPALSMPWSWSWTSDVSAPDAPTISLLSGVLPAGGAAGYRVDFGALPAGARHLIVEGQINSGGFTPFSNRAKFESAAYMKFRGDIAAVEAAGERNEAHLSFMKGLAAGDVVQVKIAAEDDVGNRSAFTTSDAVTLASAAPKIWIEDAELATGETGTVTVHLIGAAGSEVTVDYASADDTAVDPNDYTGISGTVTFPASADTHQTATIAINATGDDPTPGTTAYDVVLSGAVGATIERATCTITVQSLDYLPVPVEGWEAVWDDTSTWEGVWE